MFCIHNRLTAAISTTEQVYSNAPCCLLGYMNKCSSTSVHSFKFRSSFAYVSSFLLNLVSTRGFTNIPYIKVPRVPLQVLGWGNLVWVIEHKVMGCCVLSTIENYENDWNAQKHLICMIRLLLTGPDP